MEAGRGPQKLSGNPLTGDWCSPHRVQDQGVRRRPRVQPGFRKAPIGASGSVGEGHRLCGVDCPSCGDHERNQEGLHGCRHVSQRPTRRVGGGVGHRRPPFVGSSGREWVGHPLQEVARLSMRVGPGFQCRFPLLRPWPWQRRHPAIPGVGHPEDEWSTGVHARSCSEAPAGRPPFRSPHKDSVPTRLVGPVDLSH